MRIGLFLFSLLFLTARWAAAQNAFGDSIPVSNGLVGRVFLLPDTTKRLPNFDSMQPTPAILYAREVNIPDTDWSAGFPGLRDRTEWFGIDYKGEFRVVHPGKYKFRLISDDGAKLFIDDSLIIDNDGQHPAYPKMGEISFADSDVHRIRLEYFQGPRFRLALQLYWTVGDQQEEVFPGKGFLLYTPKKHGFPWWWLLLIPIIGGWWWWAQKRKKKKEAAGVAQAANGASLRRS